MSNLKITEVRLRIFDNEDLQVVAKGSITIEDAFVVHDVKLVRSSDDTLFLAMPSKRVGDLEAEKGTFLDIAHPINAETRTYIQDKVLEEYNRLIEEGLKYSLEEKEE